MKKAAFAAMAALAVVALCESNLRSQFATEAGLSAPPGGDLVSEEEHLRSKLRKLVEMNAKTMSADELREAIGVMERFSVEPEFAPIVEQLQAIVQKHSVIRPEPTFEPPEQAQVRLKAELAVELLQTQDLLVLMAVQKALHQKSVPEKPAIPTLDGKRR